MVEVLASALLIAVAVGSLFFCFGQGVTFTGENNLNMRAMQIVGEKMETIRLYTWDQITNGTVPSSFTNYFYPNGDSNGNVGITFTGTLAITNVSLTEGYSNDLRQVIVTVNWYPNTNWTTGNFQHQLQAYTMVSHYGMQNYVYSSK